MPVKECAICGYKNDTPFKDDVCPSCNQTFWKCRECGFVLKGENIPEQCPSCFRKCEFKNVTCYTPECGGPGHLDKTLL